MGSQAFNAKGGRQSCWPRGLRGNQYSCVTRFNPRHRRMKREGGNQSLAMIPNRSKHPWILFVGLGGLVLIAALSWSWFQGSSFSYRLWKRGLNPFVGQGVQRGILSDPDVERVFIGKTATELASILGDVHPTEGSFDLLVSKNLGPRKPGQAWLQWGDRYFVFELTDGRVTAVRRVHG